MLKIKTPCLPIVSLLSISIFFWFIAPSCFAEEKPYSLASSINRALEAARLVAEPLIATSFHKGRQLVVPDQFGSIQEALDMADSGDSVVVKSGIYYERLFIRDGIRLVSWDGDAGHVMERVTGALTKLPRRTLRTIIDGSQDQLSPVGMLTFSSGAGRNTIIDGFTIQNLPPEDHHNPGHSHAVNLRGASPVIMNCYVRNNGSTGIGNHVAYFDRNRSMSQRDFRRTNVEHVAGALIYRNIVAHNLGRGIGCNHFATSFVLGNEVFGNDDSSLGAKPGPGIGVKHGAAPTIVGNIVHDNPFGGIKGKQGVVQGKFPVDFPPRPVIRANVVFRNGEGKPGISCNRCGTAEQPVEIDGNFIFSSGTVGINISNRSVGIVTNNIVTDGCSSGISVRNSKLIKLAGNVVQDAREAAIVISADSQIMLYENNKPTGKKGDGPP